MGLLCVQLGCRFREERFRVPGALLLAALLAAGLGLLGAVGKPPPKPPGTAEALRQGLDSADPVRRFYAVRGTRAAGPAAAPFLLRALEDPVINVRYGAAEALGAVPAPVVADRLLAVLASREEWYVKERAYASLWRLGWRPGVEP
jgi:HEAT repeat protein